MVNKDEYIVSCYAKRDMKYGTFVSSSDCLHVCLSASLAVCPSYII